jgi:exodeoxyribonuclease V alpha subunit
VITALDGDRAELTGPGGTTTMSAGSLAAARPAWAMTIHRAHGSVWPAVVAVLPGEAAGTLSRPLAYTAFTSAFRHLSVVHAAGPGLAHAVRTVGHQPRRTRLAALLREAASLGP